MTQEQATAILWGKEVRTSAQVAEQIELNRIRAQKEKEIDDAACREGKAVANAFRTKRPRG